MQELTKDQKQEVVNWMQSKGINPVCPTCNSSNLGIAMVANLGAGANNGTVNTEINGENLVPVVQVACMECGKIRHFSAVVMGLVN